MNLKTEHRPLGTAEVAAVETPASGRVSEEPSTEAERSPARSAGEELAALFSREAAKSYSDQWDAVQTSFVDDPKQAVRRADELVAQVLKNLAETFSAQRITLEDQSNDGASTENLRVALRRYRSFFRRLLSI